MAKQARQYRLERVPEHVRAQFAPPLEVSEHLFPLTVQQVAEACGLSPDLIRRRLNNQRIRDWPKLTRSGAAGKRANIQAHQRRMSAEKSVDHAEHARERARMERVRAGHKTI